MAILSDRWIREETRRSRMIEPFVEGQKREGVISYGLSSYGYDARVADEFKIFTNIDSAVVDPKDFAANSFVDKKTDCCIIPPNSFALARTVGWVAQWNEMISDPEQKIGRPRQLYTGPTQRDYVPVDKR